MDNASTHCVPMNYRTIQLTDIALRDLTPFKITLKRYGAQDHSRWVFRGALPGSSESFFYKIWNPSHVRRDNILAGIESGFYDERMVPALYALIFHKGLCRGYVMNEGKFCQDASSDRFCDFVYLRSSQTGYFFVQFGHSHMMVYKGKRSLLDLEGVYPLEAFPRLSQYHCEIWDSAYELYVAKLYKELLARTTSDVEAAAFDASLPTNKAVTSPGIRAALQRFCVRPSRKILYGVRNFLPRTHLIQY